MIAPLLANIVVKQSNHVMTTEYEYHYIISYIDQYKARNSHIYLTIWSYDTIIVYK